jgi:hypothetical protein
MRVFLFVVLALGMALAQASLKQASLKGITPKELEGVFQEAQLAYERTGPGEYRLEMAGLKRVWLYLDYCQGERCGVLTLSAGFTPEEPPDLDLLIPFFVVYFAHDRSQPPDPERATTEGQEGQGPDREGPFPGRRMWTP